MHSAPSQRPSSSSPSSSSSSSAGQQRHHDPCAAHVPHRDTDYQGVAVGSGYWYDQGRAGYRINTSLDTSVVVDPAAGGCLVSSSCCPVHGRFPQQFASPICHHHPEFHCNYQQHQQILSQSNLAATPSGFPLYCQTLPQQTHCHHHVGTCGTQLQQNFYHPPPHFPVLPSQCDEHNPCFSNQSIVGTYDTADHFWPMDAGLSTGHHPDCQFVAAGTHHIHAVTMRQHRDDDESIQSRGDKICGGSDSGDLAVMATGGQEEVERELVLGGAMSSGVDTNNVASLMELLSSTSNMAANSAADSSVAFRSAQPVVTDDVVTSVSDIHNTEASIPLLSSSARLLISDSTLRSHTPPERDLNPTVSGINQQKSPTSTSDQLVLQIDEQLCINDGSDVGGVDQPTVLQPSSLAFTIDFGHNNDQPQITDRWTHPTPYRAHRSVRQQTSAAKVASLAKQHTVDSERNAKGDKTSKVSQSKKSTFHCEQQEASAGYLSDGHASSVSSDNEATSVCSEVVGRALVFAGEKRLQQIGPVACRSQPSLIQSKVVQVSQLSQLKTKDSLSSTEQPRPALSSAGKARPISAHRTTDLKPDSSKGALRSSAGAPKKNLSSKKDSKLPLGHRIEGSGKQAGERTFATTPASHKSKGSQQVDEMLDVTTYLINRMLGAVPAALGDGSSTVRGKQHASATSKSPAKVGDALRDNVSEAGTYTIDDDVDDTAADEVRQARECIETVFGVGESCAVVSDGHGRIVRPVIDTERGDLLASADDDVFVGSIAVGDELQQHDNIEITETVSAAPNASYHAAEQGLEYCKSGLPVDAGQLKSFGEKCSLTAASADYHSTEEELYDHAIEGKPLSGTTDDSHTLVMKRHCATVICESGGDSGTFTISYDAPSPRLRQDTRRLPLEDFTKSQSHMASETYTTSEECTNISQTVAEQGVLEKTTNRPTVEEFRSQTTESGCRPKQFHPAPQRGKKPSSSIPVARSVGDVSRASRAEYTMPRALQKSGRQTPPSGLQPTLSYWRPDVDMSDAGSEAGSACSARAGRTTDSDRRRSAPRSAPAVPTRINRTFALRCAAKQRTESGGSPASSAVTQSGKGSRSHSVENSGRSALSGRSRSSSRVRGQHETDNDGWRRRQVSEDSSLTSVSSNLSIATHDGTFSRRDGGRCSLRVEKSSTTGCLASVAKQLQPWDKSRVSSIHQHPKPVSTAVTESKELNAWKRRKEYDARKSVADSKARRGSSAQHEERSSVSRADVASQETGLPTTDEIAKLSSAVAYNLSVLSQSTQSKAVNLDLPEPWLLSTDISRSAFTVPSLSPRKSLTGLAVDTGFAVTHSHSTDDKNKSTCDAVLVDSIQQMSSKVKSLTDCLMEKVKEEGKKCPGDVPGPDGVPTAWQSSSPELAAILENLKKTEQHLQVVHRALFESRGSRHANSSRSQQQHLRAVTQQSLQHAELAGFRPIDNPATTETVGTARNSYRRRSTGGGQRGGRKLSNESNSSINPLSGDEYY